MKKIREAVLLFRSGQYDRSLGVLNEVASYENIPRDIASFTDFYRAEILFKKMEFGAALDIYLRLYRVEESKYFRFGEDAHVRAVLCAEITGNTDLMKKLVSEYREAYGDSGRYASFLEKL